MMFNLLKKKHTETQKRNVEAVIVELVAKNLSGGGYRFDDVSTLENKIDEIIKKNNLGEFDGNEFGPGVITLYMYGPDSEKLFSSIKPVLEESPLCKNARVIIRQGGPGSKQREEVIA